MSLIFATNGSKLFIGGAAKTSTGADFTASDFTSVTWTEIKGLTDLGVIGDTSESIKSNHIGIERTRKAKGSRDGGTMQVVADLDYADAGQLAVIAAEKSRYSWPFKIELNDEPSGGTPSLRYFTALVMSATEAYNQANSVMSLSASLDVDSNLVKVAAGA